jgi:cytochrome P450
MGYGESAEHTAESPIPDHVPKDLVLPLDHWNGVDYLADPLGFWDPLRDTVRVFWSPYHGGFWCLTRYADIHEAFQRPDLFSSRITNIPGREVDLLPISLDPPDHSKYRRLLNQPFNPVRMDGMNDRIRERSRELIDPILEEGRCDFVSGFAKALPTTIFCELLGLPVDELDTFLEWNFVILHVHGDAAGLERQRRANDELAGRLRALLEERKATGGDDLISMLIPLEVAGHSLTDDEIIRIAHLLFMAGLDTVTAGLAWSWKFLAEHPAHRQQIIDEPALIPNAVEELLRFFSFVEVSRTVTHDMEFAGVAMRAGDRIMLPTSSAGRDEAQFPNAMTVDFHREPNRHLAFASGPHRCVGSHLARAELRTGMEEWHKAIPHYRITEDAEIHYHGGAVGGPDNLPLELATS